MRIAILHLAPLEPSPTLLVEDIERSLSLGRALARRGHAVHVLAHGLDLPEALRPATEHLWRAFGVPSALGGGATAPFNVHLARTAPSDDDTLLARFAAAVSPDVVITDLAGGRASAGLAVAEEARAALVVRVPPAAEPLDFDEREAALARAALVVAPSAHALRLLPDLGARAEVHPEGVDSRALQPEPRGALPRTPAPPLPHGMRCVLFDGDGDHDPLGRALLAAASNALQRRVDLGLVMPAEGAVASDIRARDAATRARTFVVPPSDVAAREELARHARLVVLGDAPGARSARRVARCLARGVLPMGRVAGPERELLAALGALVPAEVAAALALPAGDDLSAHELGARIHAVLEHPEVPFLGPRLAAFAARELDWSVRAQALERTLERRVAADSLARSA